MTTRDEEITSMLPRDLDALPRLRGFRLRGLEMTRLETFVDATFAFAITMLVIAAERVPDNIDELLAAFRNVPAFAASVYVLSLFWRGHWLWSRRFGLEDGVSTMITWTLIFTMLIYVYPLKVIFGSMFYFLSDGQVGQRMMVNSTWQGRWLFAAYGIGFTAFAVEMILLNARAWQLRAPLRLNAQERFTTIGAITGWAIPALVGLTSVVLALTLPRGWITWSGWVYFLLILLVPLHSRWERRQLAKIPP